MRNHGSWHSQLRNDHTAMEEIGFIYVLALSIILLSAIFYTISDTQSTQKKTATTIYYEDVVHTMTQVVQDVLDMQFIHPHVNYTRFYELKHTDLVYQYRVEFSSQSVTLISRLGNIRVSSLLYNPNHVQISASVGSDARAIRIKYDPQENTIDISVVALE